MVISPQPSRRNILKGEFRAPEMPVLRPPRAAHDFMARCDRCLDCATACPEDIITPGEDGRPVLAFSRGACTFCGECAEACPSGALDPEIAPDWTWKAEVTSACLSLQGITCRACEDVCDPQAIRFRLAIGGKSTPTVDPQLCNGCGACAHACPAEAVNFKNHLMNLGENPR